MAPKTKKRNQGEDQKNEWVLCPKSGYFFHVSNQGEQEKWLETGLASHTRVSGHDKSVICNVHFLSKSELKKWQKLSTEYLDFTIFMPEDLMRIANLFFGDFVTLELEVQEKAESVSNSASIPFRVCPLNSQESPGRVALIQDWKEILVEKRQQIKDNNEKSDETWCKIAKLTEDVKAAQKVAFETELDEDMDQKDLQCFVKERFQDILVKPNLEVKTSFLGKIVFLNVSEVIAPAVNIELCEKLDRLHLDDSFYLILPSTEVSILDSNRTEKEDEKFELGLGGLEKEVERVKSVIENRITNGILLWGVPGTGKSAFGRVISHLVGMSQICLSLSELFSKFYGESEDNVRNVFKEARAKQPCVLFIDDLDGLFSDSEKSSKSDQERRILSSLLICMDEVHRDNCHVFVVSATSRILSIDQNLRRPGRFDVEVEFPVPTPIQRKCILEEITKDSKVDQGVLEEISQITHAFVGADLRALVIEASNSMVMSNDQVLSRDHFQKAMKLVKPSAMKEVLIEVPNVKWTDIGGLDDLKLSLKQAVEWPLKRPEVFLRFGITPPKGLLMYGPPGCSKTMIAKALANESGLNFLAIKGPELFSKWVGESEKAVRELFRKARQVAPAIIFFDEIDALGSQRGESGSGKVGDRVLAQMLTEMDGIEQLKDVTIVAATNRPDMIDSALMRPGRLDRLFYVPLPDKLTRAKIFEIHTKNKPLNKDISLDSLVERTDGYSGAEISAICNEAALKALEESLEAKEIHERHFETALNLIQPRINPDLIKIYDRFRKKM